MSNFRRDKTFTQPVNWTTTFFMGAFHGGTIAALFFFTWKALALAVVLWWVSGSLGIGMGYHRLLTHRGYKTPKWLEYILTLCGTLALEGGPMAWVATHRVHHQNTDKEGDPHSPRDGGLWAHMGWIMTGKALHNTSGELLPFVQAHPLGADMSCPRPRETFLQFPFIEIAERRGCRYSRLGDGVYNSNGRRVDGNDGRWLPVFFMRFTRSEQLRYKVPVMKKLFSELCNRLLVLQDYLSPYSYEIIHAFSS
jgi:hypothetical protein